jgi:hypothetical protein
MKSAEKNLITPEVKDGIRAMAAKYAVNTSRQTRMPPVAGFQR